MITLFQIDKSGGDIFEKDYSIVLVINKKKVYGINIPQNIKDDLINRFKTGDLNIHANSEKKRKNRFRLRFHTSVVIKLIEYFVSKNSINELNIENCNDFDGHFHEIKDMVFKNISKIIPHLKREDIIQAKFPKDSLIDKVAKDFRSNNKERIKNYTSIKLNSKDLIKMIRR